MANTDRSTPDRAERGRFRGLPAETLEFFRALHEEPCPDTMPGGDRVAYAAHVLSPFKALISDLGTLLSDISPPLGHEARVGASLDWPDGAHKSPEKCPVRRIRLWDAARDPERSPLLYVVFHADEIRVGSCGRPADTAGLDSPVADLRSAGWTVTVGEVVRAERALRWEPWIDEPGLVHELADAFRRLLPLFDSLRNTGNPEGASVTPRR